MSITPAAQTVLVVDDEADIREAVELALSMEGFTVVGAPDRDAALKIIEQQKPYLILLDFRMPGLTAQEFMQIIQARNIETPIILMTAGKDPSDQARELKVAGYLQKPFELTDLLNLVRQYTA
ncbi:MAG TPA: response regulator [Planctomycetota bacterium]|nr:response regulator [Planctomycetota bacterium]